MMTINNTNGRIVSAFVILLLLATLVTSCTLNPFNKKPVAVITIAQGSPIGPAPLTITFNISSSSDPDGHIVSFTIDFADGSNPVTGTDLTSPITHTFTEVGQHFVTLTVVDNGGKEGITQVLIIVSSPTG